ncbi:hypothetical protein GDO81_017943 [Engystomops pustulosus]|uniref:Hexosyltransferase n=1 Tax=Engystomops pustulosus TaxID=76066 RepID=A0AAV7A4I7_ENGPU|nr:hypothetical protein GDO81_017943 [Engystomops pustulosus]
MELPKKSFKAFILAIIYTIALVSLLAAYHIYWKGHLSYQNPRNKMSPLNNPERKKYQVQRIEDVQSKTQPYNLTLEYINITSYPYIMNEPNKCKDESPFLIFLIATVANEVESRRAIRTTFGATLENGATVMCLFLLGKDNTQESNSILEESEKHHDIIQKDFQDTYNNLPIKILMGIEWVSNYCPRAKYVMKTDSDMFVNTYRLMDLLGPDQPQKQNFFTGFVLEKHRPHRNKDSKWHMPYSQYAGEFYPTFCSGTGYVFSGDVAPKILNSSFHVKYIYLEDVFVGLCLDREGVKVTAPPHPYLFNNYRVRYQPCVYNRIITSHYMTPTDIINYWKITQEYKEKCSKSR